MENVKKEIELNFIIQLIKNGKLEDHLTGKPYTISSKTLYDQYCEYYKKSGFGRPKILSEFYKTLIKHRLGQIMKKCRPRTNEGRTNAYEFSYLSECINLINRHGLVELKTEQILKDSGGDWVD